MPGVARGGANLVRLMPSTAVLYSSSVGVLPRIADSTTTVDPPEASAPALDPAQAGVVVAGPWRGLSSDLAGYRGALADWLERSGWPLLADPLAALPVEWPGRVHHWPLLLDQFHGGSDLQVLRLGSMPASRALERWLAAARGPQVLISEGDARPLDPLGRAAPWSGGGAHSTQSAMFSSIGSSERSIMCDETSGSPWVA